MKSNYAWQVNLMNDTIRKIQNLEDVSKHIQSQVATTKTSFKIYY